MIIFLFHLLHLLTTINIPKNYKVCKGAYNKKIGFQPQWSKSYISFHSVYFKTVCNYFICCKKLFFRKVLQKCCKNSLAIWGMSANPHKYWVFRHIIAPNVYSHSTITNQFCLVIILCRVRCSFDYLIYPYYPAYTS